MACRCPGLPQCLPSELWLLKWCREYSAAAAQAVVVECMHCSALCCVVLSYGPLTPASILSPLALALLPCAACLPACLPLSLLPLAAVTPLRLSLARPVLLVVVERWMRASERNNSEPAKLATDLVILVLLLSCVAFWTILDTGFSPPPKPRGPWPWNCHLCQSRRFPWQPLLYGISI